MILQTGSKKEAERLVKNIIKIVIKIAVLHRNGQFSIDETKLADKFRNKFQMTQMAVISFHEVDFSFDLQYIQKSLLECQTILKQFVQPHLTDKSLNRIDEVFNFFADSNLLETSFKLDSPYKDVIGKIVADLNKAMDNGDI